MRKDMEQRTGFWAKEDNCSVLMLFIVALFATPTFWLMVARSYDYILATITSLAATLATALLVNSGRELYRRFLTY